MAPPAVRERGPSSSGKNKSIGGVFPSVPRGGARVGTRGRSHVDLEPPFCDNVGEGGRLSDWLIYGLVSSWTSFYRLFACTPLWYTSHPATRQRRSDTPLPSHPLPYDEFCIHPWCILLLIHFLIQITILQINDSWKIKSRKLLVNSFLKWNQNKWLNKKWWFWMLFSDEEVKKWSTGCMKIN